MADRHYKVLVGDGALTLDDLHNPVGQEEIKIVPVIAGAGGDVGRTLLGAALLTASFFFLAASGKAVLTLFGSTFTATELPCLVLVQL